MGRLKKLKKIRIHREGTHTLAGSLLLILAVNAGLYFGLECKIPFYVVAVISLVVYGILVNFFRCPIRLFGQENTEKIVCLTIDRFNRRDDPLHMKSFSKDFPEIS